MHQTERRRDNKEKDKKVVVGYVNKELKELEELCLWMISRKKREKEEIEYVCTELGLH